MDTATTGTGRRHRSAARAASAEDNRAARRARREGSQMSLRSFLHATNAIARGSGGPGRAATGGGR
eukprot:5001087-Lingulodinium_polyedra.AAC.1